MRHLCESDAPVGPFSTGPEVFDYRHPDLAPNADKAWLNTLNAQGNNITPQTFSNHATMVAGVMVAARNGEGGVGAAYNASLADYYQKRSCLRPYFLGYGTKRRSKQARNSPKRPLARQNSRCKIKELTNSRHKYASSPINMGASSYELASKQQRVIYATR
jgi:Subtilase family